MFVMKSAILFLASIFLYSNLALAKIQVAVTVDDLPLHGALPSDTTRLQAAEKMLKALEKHKVPEVYGFMNARKIENDPTLEKVVLAWVKSGYPLGNHSYAHKSITDLSAKDYNAEIDRNESTLAKYNQGMDWKYYRYPFLREGEELGTKKKFSGLSKRGC